MPRLGKVEKIVAINQNDPKFDGSSYQEDSFVVLMHTGIRATIANEVGRKNASAEWESLDGVGDVPAALLGKHIVLAIIEDWNGFLDTDGNEMNPTLANKSAMYDYDAQFFDLLYLAYVAHTKPENDSALDDAVGKQEDTSDGNIQNQEEDQEATLADDVENQ